MYIYTISQSKHYLCTVEHVIYIYIHLYTYSTHQILYIYCIVRAHTYIYVCMLFPIDILVICILVICLQMGISIDILKLQFHWGKFWENVDNRQPPSFSGAAGSPNYLKLWLLQCWAIISVCKWATCNSPKSCQFADQ